MLSSAVTTCAPVACDVAVAVLLRFLTLLLPMSMLRYGGLKLLHRQQKKAEAKSEGFFHPGKTKTTATMLIKMARGERRRMSTF